MDNYNELRSFLEWLYTTVGIDLAVFDRWYSTAARQQHSGNGSPALSEFMEWYRATLGDD